MKRCALLTTEDADDHGSGEERLAIALRALGWEVEWVPWREPREWDVFHAVVVRSTWDYHLDPGAFHRVLEAIDASGTPLFNPLPALRWNARKDYLRELHAKGIPTIPTHWQTGFRRAEFSRHQEALDSEQLVVKPAVSASAWRTYRLGPDTDAKAWVEAEDALAGLDVLVQPFLPAFAEEGEWSVILVDGRASHTIRRIPGSGEFRTQEEYGGRVEGTSSGEAAALEAMAESWIADLPWSLLFARVDLVRGRGGEWLLSELELVEPNLYLAFGDGAAERLAREIDRRS